MLFSSGLPILYPILAIKMLVYYFVDKYLMMRIFRKPADYDAEMHKEMVEKLYRLPFYHCLLAILIFGCAQIFYDSDNTNSNIPPVKAGE